MKFVIAGINARGDVIREKITAHDREKAADVARKRILVACRSAGVYNENGGLLCSIMRDDLNFHERVREHSSLENLGDFMTI